MENKSKHTPGPEDIIQAVSSENLANLLESASMELDWSDTPDQVRDELEQDAGQIIREAARMESVNAELLAALYDCVATLEEREQDENGEAALEAARAAIRKAKGDK